MSFNKTKYLRKALKFAKAVSFFNIRKHEIRTLHALLNDGLYCVYHTKEQTITFKMVRDKDELLFIKKKINIDKKPLNAISRQQKSIYTFKSEKTEVMDEYLLSVEDLYTNSLEVSAMNNTLRDVLSPLEFSHLVFHLSKHNNKNHFIKFCLRWKLFESASETIHYILQALKVKNIPEDIDFLTDEQKGILCDLFKDELDNNFKFVNIIGNKSLSAQISHCANLLNDLLMLLDEHNRAKSKIHEDMNLVFKKILQYDNSYRGMFFFIINYPGKNDNMSSRLNLYLKEHDMALLDKNDKTIDFDNLVCKDYMEDSVMYSDLALSDVTQYFSYLIRFNYSERNRTFKESFEKRLSRLLNKRFKHNISMYERQGNIYISVLSLYQHDLIIFLKVLANNLNYLLEDESSEFLYTYNNSLTIGYNKAIAKYVYDSVTINFDV